MLYSSVTTGNFFFPKQLSYLRPIFVNLSTEKHLYCQLIVAFEKKDLKIKAERRRNHWRQKRVVFQKTFWTSPRKTGNFEGIAFFLCLVNEISRKSFPNNYRSVEAKFILLKETLKAVNEFAFCLLIGQIGSSFFLWKKCFVSQLFFLDFKRTLLIVLLQVRRMKVKATMRQILFGQKIEGKGKKLQYG